MPLLHPALAPTRNNHRSGATDVQTHCCQNRPVLSQKCTGAKTDVVAVGSPRCHAFVPNVYFSNSSGANESLSLHTGEASHGLSPILGTVRHTVWPESSTPVEKMCPFPLDHHTTHPTWGRILLARTPQGSQFGAHGAPACRAKCHKILPGSA